MGKNVKQIDDHGSLRSMRDKKNCAALAIGIGAAAGVALMLLFAPADDTTQFIRMYCCIAATLLLVYGLYIAFRAAAKNRHIAAAAASPSAGNIYGAIIIAVTAAGLIAFKIFGQPYMFAGEKGSTLAFAFMLLIMWLLCLEMARHDIPSGKIIISLACVFVYIVIFFYSYTPNVFNTSLGMQTHYIAVSQSIYNVACNTPITQESSGIYGHYALFFWPIMKLFGHTPQVIALCIVALNFIAEAAFIALLFRLTKNTTLRVLPILASGCMFSVVNYYYMNFPFRIVCPLLILNYILWGYQNNRSGKKYYIIGYILCGLTVIWSTDTGIACTLVFTVCGWMRAWKTEKLFSKKMVRIYLLSLLGVVGAVFEMIAAVNIYNILCGGELIFLECFFPLFTGHTMENTQFSLLEYGVSSLIPTCVFLCSVCMGMLPLSFLKVSDDDRLCLAFVGVMGLGQAYYYYNNALTGWNTAILYLLLALVQWCEPICRAKRVEDKVNHGGGNGRPGLFDKADKAAGAAGLLCICFFSLRFLMISPGYVSYELETVDRSLDSMQSVAEMVESTVPKDTYAYGVCTQELYAYMGWDPIYHKRDPAGVGVDDMALALYDEINSQDAVLVCVAYDGIIRPDSGLTLKAEIPAEAPVFRYYERTAADAG